MYWCKSGLFLMLCGAALCSCSTTRVLKNADNLLVSNTINMPDSINIHVSELSPYLKQQPNSSFAGIKPGLIIYNWSNGSGRFFDRIWKKLGEEPVVYSDVLQDATARSIERRLEYLGYYGSVVNSSVTIKNKKARVTYDIEPGSRYLIESVSFDIPSGGDFEQDFYSDTSAVTVRPGDYLSAESLDSESARSSSQLRSQGYFALNKAAYSFVADTTSGAAHLKYSIVPGAFELEKAYFSDVRISVPDDCNFSPKVLDAMNLIKSGQMYNEKVVNTTYSRLSALKMFSSIGVGLTQVSSDSIDCEISLAPSLPQGFKTNLEVSTNSSALMGVSPQIEYYHKNLFGGGEWLTVGFTGNFQFRLDNSLRSTEAGVSASLSLPKFLGLSYSHFTGAYVPRTEFNLSFNHQNRPEYSRNLFAFSMGYTGRFKDNLYYKAYPLSVNYVYLNNIDPEFSKSLERNPYMRYTYQDHLDAGVSLTLYKTTSTSVVPKGAYNSNRLTVDISGNLLSAFKALMPLSETGEALLAGAPFSQYARAEYSFAKGIRLGQSEKSSVAFRVLAGVGFAYGNSSSLPYEKQFYCGGAQSMRGWQVRSLGPGSSALDKTFAIPSQTGDMKLEADVEYRFPVSGVLEGALFAEVGNVWNMKEFDYKALGADYGLGLRINMDFLLVRLDIGVQLHDPSLSENGGWMNPWQALSSGGYAFHFGVGYPF